MATIINERPRDLGGNIGRELGAGLGQGYEEAQTRRQAEVRSRRLNSLIEKAKDAPDRDSAIKLMASPEYSDLFSSVEEFRTFGQLIDDIHKGEDVEAIDFTNQETGDRRTAFVPASTLREAANAPDQDAFFSDLFGAKVSIGFDEKNSPDLVDIVNESGGTVAMIPEDQFDPEKHLQGGKLMTADDFTRRMQLNKENRLKAQGGENGAGKPSDAQRRAMGVLQTRGVDNPDEKQVNRAMGIIERSDKFSPRLATTFGMEQRGETFIEKLKGSGAAERFAAAQTAMPDLMFSGLTDTQAFKSARVIGNAIPIKERNFDHDPARPETGPEFVTKVKEEVPTVDPATDAGKKTLQRLDPRKDKGKVFQQPDGSFLVYVGGEKGNPEFELVQP